MSPWYDLRGWLGVKQQLSIILSILLLLRMMWLQTMKISPTNTGEITFSFYYHDVATDNEDFICKYWSDNILLLLWCVASDNEDHIHTSAHTGETALSFYHHDVATDNEDFICKYWRDNILLLLWCVASDNEDYTSAHTGERQHYPFTITTYWPLTIKTNHLQIPDRWRFSFPIVK